MKTVWKTIICITGIYCLVHLLFGFHINQTIAVFGYDTGVTFSLFTRITGAIFFGSLFVYFKKYTTPAST
ncbi:hypothetical protein [Salibacterium qingdaonense]|uniref:Uncharacterized protein n=1 Tax=Salibacterium qingdaonense TaxID=266892 RepID=A0A1I4N4E3_9BACI|nr:hypothetical protein [Salibacterium qingdaonense]SFM10265.1 hypothetical protein SAMN04488054_11523 [Salibacterium qingdaonense]